MHYLILKGRFTGSNMCTQMAKMIQTEGSRANSGNTPWNCDSKLLSGFPEEFIK
jgi:hypothetical protein